MKLSYINSPAILKDYAEKINLSAFNDINTRVTFLISSDYDSIKIAAGKYPRAICVPLQYATEQIQAFKFLNEINNHIGEGWDYMIIVGNAFSDIDQKEKEEVIIHELQHVRQHFEHPDIFAKNNLLDFISPELNIKNFIPPTEKDANYKATKKNNNYSWIDDVNNLYSKHKKLIEEIHQNITRGKYYYTSPVSKQSRTISYEYIDLFERYYRHTI